MIKHILLENFKNVSRFDSDLEKINVLVGTNNSGKSSVLQGIHFSILAEAVRRTFQRNTLSQEQLLYVPSSDFMVLRHDAPYSNYSGNTSKLEVTGDTCSDGENADTFSITISKGRNFGNVSIYTTNNNPFRQTVTSNTDLYTAYVPGLSGIPLAEKLQTKAVIRSATANGDSNLYLRNVLYYIKENGDLSRLNTWINMIFPDSNISLPYEPERDININVMVQSNGVSLPFELNGLGFLQIVQIMAYTLLFKPKLLLLDEPDEHLHPNNQLMLADAIRIIADETNTQVILCTHSRHMLTALDEETRYIWMKNGEVYQSDASSDMYSVLMDIGALDTFDKVINRTFSCVVLTEDKKIKMMKKLLEFNGFDMNRTLVIEYKGCANIESAIQLADFIHKSAPSCKVIIHRDRDFMTENEMNIVDRKIRDENTIPFITHGSDIESYFIIPEHMARIIGAQVDEIISWLNQLASENHVEIQEKFCNKRREIEYSFLYRKNREDCPDVLELFGRTVPTVPENRLGKYMLRKINGCMHQKFGCSVDLVQNSEFLRIAVLQDVLLSLS